MMKLCETWITLIAHVSKELNQKAVTDAIMQKQSLTASQSAAVTRSHEKPIN